MDSILLNDFSKTSRCFTLSLVVAVAFHAFILFFSHVKGVTKSQNFSKRNSSKSELQTTIRFKTVSPKKEIKKIAKRGKSLKKKKVAKLPKKTVTPVVSNLDQSLKKVKNASGINTAMSQYKNQIRQLLNENRHYPRVSRKLGQTGEVLLAFAVSKDGNIKNLKIESKCPFAALNRSAIKTIQRIGKFPPLPKIFDKDVFQVLIPIVFNLDS